MPDMSSFQFTNPELISFQFEKNTGFLSDGRIEMPISLQSSIIHETGETGSGERKAKVSIEISVGAKEGNKPFFFKATESADFKWNADDYSEEQIDSLLRQNAVALLISYVRPVISNLTAASGLPCYNLPFLNLADKKSVE